MVKETPFGKVIKEGAKETSNVDRSGRYTKRGPKGVQMGSLGVPKFSMELAQHKNNPILLATKFGGN